MRLNVEGEFSGNKRRIAKAAVRLLVAGGYRPYQPVFLDGLPIKGGEREADVRLDAFLPLLQQAEVRSVLDMGSAEGYLARRCAEEGYATLGVEQDLRRLMLAQWSAALDGVEGLGFWRLSLTPETINLLPTADATIFLSVLHHMIYEHGLDYGKAVLKAIRSKTSGILVFEMGQSDEVSSAWASQLPDMGDDPHDWIAALLEEAGFRDIEKIAQVSGWGTSVARATFAAR